MPNDKSHLQELCYQRNYDKYFNEYDWLTFLDIDEFIYLEEGSGYTTIQQFLDEPIFNDTDNIILTWKYYDDNGIIDVKDGNYSVLKRFTHQRFKKAEGDPNSLSKAIYRGKVNRNYIVGNHCIQGFQDYNGRKYVFRKADGRIMKFKGIGWCFYNSNNTHFPVSIHHFETKSISEYINNKIKKHKFNSKYSLKHFFDKNNVTQEKVDYLKKELGELLKLSHMDIRPFEEMLYNKSKSC